MYQLAFEQQTSCVKLPAIFLRFQTKKRILRVNKNEIACGNACNGDFVEIGDNHESSKDWKTCFEVFLEIYYPCYKPQTEKYVYLTNFHTKFEQTKPDIWCFNVLACCCEANQYNEITVIFFKDVKLKAAF